MVIIVRGDQVLRVQAKAFAMVMSAAGQMEDDWMEYYPSTGKSVKASRDGLRALNNMQRIARMEIE
jgi:hypothetical protein